MIALKAFMNKVKNLQAGCVIKILRIKNGFGDMLDWESEKDANYKDLKLNLLIVNKLNNNQCVVGELQLLLKFLLKAKKIGHKVWFCFVFLHHPCTLGTITKHECQILFSGLFCGCMTMWFVRVLVYL